MSVLRYVFCSGLRRPTSLSTLAIRSTAFCSKYQHKECNSAQHTLYPVYRSSVIPVCSIVNKLKKFQLYGVGIILPASCALHLTNVVSSDILFVTWTVGIASTAALFTVGQLFTGLIGFVYATENTKNVKISYIDFWGKRKDVLTTVDDIKPLVSGRLFSKVQRFSSDDSTKLSLKFGEIINTQAFVRIFKYDPD